MKRLYIIAGERSGDLHGSNLTKALLARDKSLSIRGFGGDEMKKAGVDVYIHYEQLAFMGFVELITKLFTIFKFIRLCKNDIEQFNPDAIILIDYGGFNRRIAKFGKQKGSKFFITSHPKCGPGIRNGLLNSNKMWIGCLSSFLLKRSFINRNAIGMLIMWAIRCWMHQIIQCGSGFLN